MVSIQVVETPIQRPRQIVVCEADGLQHGPGRRPVGAVGERRAVPLGGVRRAVVRVGHGPYTDCAVTLMPQAAPEAKSSSGSTSPNSPSTCCSG